MSAEIHDGQRGKELGLIPAKIVRDAAEPVREVFRLAAEGLPPVYGPLMNDLAANFLDPALDGKTVWDRHGLNAKYHSSLLTNALGDSVWTFIRKRRIETAARLLENKKIAALPLHTIAFAAGFNSTNALNAAFKVWSGGVPPSEYRKMRFAEGTMGPPVVMKEVGAPRPDATIRKTLRDAYRLTMRGDCDNAAFDTSLCRLGEADALVKQHTLADLNGDVAAHRGLVHHCRGSVRMMNLDVDGAYADLAAARSFYGASPRLPMRIGRARKHLLYSDDTKFLLLEKLCTPCRAELLAERNSTIRQHLSCALDPVPLDLEWFQVCCDRCYRVVWEAIGKARLGLIPDAWRAFWLAAHADPLEEVPPSIARYVRALQESEVLTHQDQSRRLELCRLAVGTARELADPLREAYARCFAANALRAMGAFEEAKATLQAAAGHCQENPWTGAFLTVMEGKLAAQNRDRCLALERLGRARALYGRLDPHLGGIALIDQGEFLFYERDFEGAIRSLREALAPLDHRRDPLFAAGVVPLNLATALVAVGRLDDAKATLARSDFDRDVHRGMAANEPFIYGCIALEEGNLEEALRLLQEAAKLLESLGRFRDRALAISYSVEAYARLGNREKAIESAADALRIFRAVGCKQDTIHAFAKLRHELEAAVIDAAPLTITVRRLARSQGGWLPEPRGLGSQVRDQPYGLTHGPAPA